MIRSITAKDKTTILKYAPLFWEEMKGKELAGDLNLLSLSYFLDSCFKSDCLVGWIHEENNEACGAILFILTTDIFTNKSILKEVFWFIIPEKRKSPITYRLIKKAEEYAKENEIQLISMMHMAHPNPDRLKDFYLKIDYTFVQSEYFKKIS